MANADARRGGREQRAVRLPRRGRTARPASRFPLAPGLAALRHAAWAALLAECGEQLARAETLLARFRAGAADGRAGPPL